MSDVSTPPLGPPDPPPSPTFDDEGKLIYPYEPGVSAKGRVVPPSTLAEANALLDNPNFRNPTGPWPSYAWVDIDEGPIRWDDYSQQFMMAWEYAPEAPEVDPNDISYQIFGPLPIPATLPLLKAHPYVGDSRMDGTFQEGEYVSLPGPPITAAFYAGRVWKAGAAPPAPRDTTTPRPQQTPGYYLNPAYAPHNEAPHPGGPHLVPAYVAGPETIPSVRNDADKIIEAIEAETDPPPPEPEVEVELESEPSP